MMELPSLQANWASRGYWGSVNQNAKSVYNFYLDPQKLQELLSLLDSFEPWFDVVTTNPPPRN